MRTLVLAVLIVAAALWWAGCGVAPTGPAACVTPSTAPLRNAAGDSVSYFSVCVMTR